jgi:hypothetical protein
MAPSETFPEPLPPGYELGQTYRIEAELAPMRMGWVYRAYDTQLNEVVAVNVLAVDLRTEFGVARFNWAIRCAVVEKKMPVFSGGEWLGVPYVVVPFDRDTGATVDVATALRSH